MELTGKIKKIQETQVLGDKGFTKRGLVITTSGEYPQILLIDFIQDKVALLDKFQEGQEVTVSINIRGNEWVNPSGERKYFNSLQGWKIENTVL